MIGVGTEAELAALAAALADDGTATTARKVAGLDEALALILAGEDPLGEAFGRIRPATVRRGAGAVYTPRAIVDAMVGWAARQGTPARVVDPGAGSGRFLRAAAAAFPDAALVAVETDPLAVAMLRANAAVLGFQDRLTVLELDFRAVALPDAAGPTLFLGNPPYVRHHGIEPRWKDWYAETARALGVKGSRLAGLHVHFLLKTLALARPGDWGVFITAAEWLDVNYGSAVRGMLADGLGGVSLTVLAPECLPFAGTVTTGAILGFRAGARGDALRVRRVERAEDLGDLEDGAPVAWAELEAAPRWSVFVRGAPKPPVGWIELGELFRVHRGQATGCNAAFIEGAYPGRLPDRVMFPTVTRARELFAAGPTLESAAGLRCVIDLPADLGALAADERAMVEAFLDWARARGAADTYLARHRAPWWSLRLRAPAPILCTYMARQPPAFVLNRAGARHLNIAHGLYPREPMAEGTLMAVVESLRQHVGMEAGRTYAGGLVKFEPREVERIAVAVAAVAEQRGAAPRLDIQS